MDPGYARTDTLPVHPRATAASFRNDITVGAHARTPSRRRGAAPVHRGGDPAPRGSARRSGGPRDVSRAAAVGTLGRSLGAVLPPELGGAGFTLPEYLAIGEQEGRTLHGPAVFGADATLDVRMLHESGSESVRGEYLAPLAAGTAVAGYGMTEPGISGSDASLLRGALSLIVVPACTPGFRVVRPLSVLGLESDQWELEFLTCGCPRTISWANGAGAAP